MPDTLEEIKETAIDVAKVGGVLATAAGVGYVGYRIYKACRGRDAATPPEPQPIDLTFADDVLKDLIPKLSLDPAFPGVVGKMDRHRIFFIHRRARELGIADPALRQGPGLENLKQQVKSELDQLDQFLVQKVGNPDPGKRGPYFGGPELLDDDARHLDLGKYISVRLLDPPPTTEAEAVKANPPDPSHAQTLRELESRRMRVFGIVLRGAALNPEVWSGTGINSTLRKAEMSEILDRRLRAVERLHYEASAGATPDKIGAASIRRTAQLRMSSQSNETDGWFDDVRYRIFEHPSMPRSTSFDPALPVEIEEEVGGQTIKRTVFYATFEDYLIQHSQLVNEPGAPRYGLNASTQRAWYQNHATDEFDWNSWPGTLLKPPLLPRPANSAPEWIVAPNGNGRGYAWVMRPLHSATVLIKELFTVKSQNLWERSWLHSDGVMSALHLEALQFSLRRRKVIEVTEKKTDEDKRREQEQRALEAAEDRRLDLELSRPGLTQDERGAVAATILARFIERMDRLKAEEDELNKGFDELATRFKLALDDYFEVRPGVARVENGIMKPGRNDYFENSAVPFDDLQIGDQVLFETNPVLQALGSTAWDYPTVLITELEYFPNVSSLDPDKLTVQGFGTAELQQPSLQLLLARTVDVTLKRVQEFIKTRFAKAKAQAQTAGRPFVPPEKLFWDPGINNQNDFLRNDRAILRVWNPYGDKWDDPGPWWIWINLLAPMWRAGFGDDVVKTLGKTPGGVVWLGNKLLPSFRGRAEFAATLPIGPGIQEPPLDAITDEDVESDENPLMTIFVPLFEPEGGWIGYFNDKAANPAAKRGPKLMPVVSDTLWLPGLAKISNNVRVIRPRLKSPA